MAIIGDHWNLRILMEAFRGVDRFNDWQRKLGISASVLTQRLQALVSDDILVTVPASAGNAGHAYRLTEAGKAMWTLMVCLWRWDDKWTRDASVAGRVSLLHERCGALTRPVTACGACGAIDLSARDTRVYLTEESSDAADQESEAGRASHYRRPTKSIASKVATSGSMRSTDILGDRWSPAVLSAAFLGCHRFSEFQNILRPIPPPTLSSRLNSLISEGVIEKAELKGAPGYRLSGKGHDFFAILVSIVNWGEEWTAAGSFIHVVHNHCGQPLKLHLACNLCREHLTRRDVHFVDSPA